MHSSLLLSILFAAAGTCTQDSITVVTDGYNDLDVTIKEYQFVANHTSYTTSTTEWPETETAIAVPEVKTHFITHAITVPDVETTQPKPTSTTKTVLTVPVWVPVTRPQSTSYTTTTVKLASACLEEDEPSCTSTITTVVERPVVTASTCYPGEPDCITTMATFTQDVPMPASGKGTVELFLNDIYNNPQEIAYEGKVVKVSKGLSTFEVSCVKGCGSDTSVMTVTEGPETFINPAQKIGRLTSSQECVLDGKEAATCKNHPVGGPSATDLPTTTIDNPIFYKIAIRDGAQKLSTGGVAAPTRTVGARLGIAGAVGLGALIAW